MWQKDRLMMLEQMMPFIGTLTAVGQTLGAVIRGVTFSTFLGYLGIFLPHDRIAVNRRSFGLRLGIGCADSESWTFQTGKEKKVL
jgi:hypothetical protein